MEPWRSRHPLLTGHIRRVLLRVALPWSEKRGKREQLVNHVVELASSA